MDSSIRLDDRCQIYSSIHIIYVYVYDDDEYSWFPQLNASNHKLANVCLVYHVIY